MLYYYVYSNHWHFSIVQRANHLTNSLIGLIKALLHSRVGVRAKSTLTEEGGGEGGRQRGEREGERNRERWERERVKRESRRIDG